MSGRKYQVRVQEGARPLARELKTAEILVQLGDILFLKENYREYTKSPDIMWRGEKWEIKHLARKGKYTVRDRLRDAVKQSGNVVLDVRWAEGDERGIIAQAKKIFLEKKSLKRMVIVAKDRKMLTFRKTKKGLDEQLNKI